MTKTVGVILSGCGYLDGAEIHEAVCTLLALDRAGAQIKCYAPDTDLDVVDHRSGEATGEKRNALAESARIARGDIEDVRNAKADDLDAVLMPGGFEFTEANFACGTAKATGDIKLDFDKTHGHFCYYHFNQGGIVRN